MNLPPSIVKVLETFAHHRLQVLLMGGQACIVYGGAEFSRDIDFAILASSENLLSLNSALRDLQAVVIAVPPLSLEVLQDGLAVHFRCLAPEVDGLRIDVMSHMRGVAPFAELWSRRVDLEGGVNVLALSDLVQAKKTQRDKDWPMITRLVEAHWTQTNRPASDAAIDFWLRELRTPAYLTEVAREAPASCRRIAEQRPLLLTALAGDEAALARLLREEEDREREADRQYWAPLRRRLEALRREHHERR